MRDEDFVVRLPIAASVPAGTPVSKYFRDCNVEENMRPYSEKAIGEKADDDPAFAIFPDECELISQDELIARRRKMMVAAGTECNSGEDIGANDPQESSSSHDAEEAEESSGNNADGLPTPCQSLESEEERQAREQEEKLAALGVTGCAKPVRTSILRAIVPPAAAASSNKGLAMGSGFSAQSGTRCVSSRLSLTTMTKLSGSSTSTSQRSNPFTEPDLRGFSGDGSPPPNQQTFSLQTPPTSACHDSRSDNNEYPARAITNNSAPSTLNYPPGSVRYAHADASGAGRAQDYLPVDRKRNNPPLPSNDSSVGMKGEKSASSPIVYSDQERFRQPTAREFSPEDDEGPKRQKDESHHREGRKAPKVAAAYR
jgi:hypothetical protein